MPKFCVGIYHTIFAIVLLKRIFDSSLQSAYCIPAFAAIGRTVEGMIEE